MKVRLLTLLLGLAVGIVVGPVLFVEPALAKEGQFVVTSEQVTYCAGEHHPLVPETGLVIQGVYHFEITFEVPPDEGDSGGLVGYDANLFDYHIWTTPASFGDESAFHVVVRPNWGVVCSGIGCCDDGVVDIWFSNANATGRLYCMDPPSNGGRTLTFSIPAFAMHYNWPGYGGPIYYQIRTTQYGYYLWQPHYEAWFATGESSNDPACVVPVAESTWGAIKQMYE